MISMDMAQNILVIKTVAGMAMAVCGCAGCNEMDMRLSEVLRGMIRSCVQSEVWKIL